MPIAELSRTQAQSLERGDPAEEPTLEGLARSLTRIETILTGIGLSNPLLQPATLVTTFVYNPFTARRIAGAQSATAFVNIEQEVRLAVFDQSILGSTPVAGASVTFVLGASQGAGLSATKGGKATSQQVTTVTGTDGMAIAYLTGGTVETVVLTGQTPNSVTTIETRTTVDIR